MRLLIAAAAALVTMCPPVLAAACGDTQAVFGALLEKYQEKPAYIADLGNGSGVLTVTISPKGTWTMIIQHDPQTACFLAGGDGWEGAPPSLAGPPFKIMPQDIPWSEVERWHGSYLRGPI